jgi:hypothetical protein
MYRLIPLRQLRRTAGVIFDEIVPSDIPVINGIDRVIHKANGIFPPVHAKGFNAHGICIQDKTII